MSFADYLVIALYLVAITAFGSWFAKFQKTTRDYFLADRSSPWWAICFTIVATETSTLSFIGVPAQAYAGNMAFLQLALGYVIGRLIVSAHLHSRVLSRRARHVLRAAATAFRAAGEDRGVGDLPGHAVARRRHSPVRDGARHRGRDRRARVAGRSSARRRDDRLHGARRRVGRDLDRRRADVRVHRGRRTRVLRRCSSAFPADGPRSCTVGSAAGKFAVLNLSTDPKVIYTFWAGLIGGVALTLATHGTDQFLVQRLLSARRRAKPAPAWC